MPLRILRLLCCVVFAAALARGSEAAPAEMLFRNWNTHHGLPQDHVRAMVRSREGFLWLGTDAGLAHFDGVNFKTYGLRDGLDAIAVVSLLEARDGALWIGTMGGGVSVWRGGKIERTYTRADGLLSGIVSVLAEDAEGRIWAGGASGFSRLENGRFALVPNAPNEGQGFVRALHCDRDGVMWASLSPAGTWRWKGGQWTKGEANGPQTVSAFCEDASGRLWAADGARRLWCREAAGWRAFAVPEAFTAQIGSLTGAPDGTVWAAFFRNGVCGLRDGRFITPVTQGEKFLDLAETVLATPEGGLWIATSTSGLFALAPRRITFATLDDPEASKAANFIGALVEDGPGEFIVGTQGRGLHRWRTGKSEPLEGFAESNRGLFGNAMLRTRDGSVWAATGRGLWQFRNGRPVPQSKANTVSAEVWDLCEDRRDGLWVGKGNGELYHLRAGGAELRPYGGGREPIKGLAQEEDGTLWIGTRGNGLFRLHGAEWRRYGREDGLLTEVIRVLYLDQHGTLWVGTAGGGLAMRKGERFVAVTTREGMPDDIMSQIAEDSQGRLWVGTNRGLAVLSADEVARIRTGAGGDLHPLVLTRADGLLSEEFTIVPPVRMKSGQWALATTHGFALLRPEDFGADHHTPPVFIDQALANGRPVELRDGRMTLPPGVERLEFQFTGLHFAAPERLRFRNRLAGLESDWGPASAERRVEYRNLAPGHYRFELSASIGNGRWSAPAAMEIALQPYFWQTAWFRAVAIGSVLAMVGFGVRWRERARARRKIEVLKQEQAVQAERARIARDLHDDVGASLTQVALLSELAQTDLARHPERASEHINEIFTTAKDVTRALDEIVWAVNPTQDTLEGFAAFLGTFVQNYARTAGLHGRLDFPETLPATPLAAAVRHHLYLATKEVLHNVVKHAGAKEVCVRLIPETDRFRLVIEDDGQGFAGATPAAGADGLLNLRKRLEQIGGSCLHRSGAGCGTAVEMMVPLR
jgi:signal transduction histidine kinase/ligand-binding sensor domain-containing protein